MMNGTSTDSHGAVIYIIGVLSWYAIGIVLILINTICSKRGSRQTSSLNFVTDLHEQQTRNDLLIELKDQDRRKKLWEIYYGTNGNPAKSMEKEKETLVSITKQSRAIQNRLEDIHYHQSTSEEFDTRDDRHSLNH